MRATNALNGLNKIEKMQEQTFRLRHNFAEAHNGNAFDALLSLESVSPFLTLTFLFHTHPVTLETSSVAMKITSFIGTRKH